MPVSDADTVAQGGPPERLEDRVGPVMSKLAAKNGPAVVAAAKEVLPETVTPLLGGKTEE